MHVCEKSAAESVLSASIQHFPCELVLKTGVPALVLVYMTAIFGPGVSIVRHAQRCQASTHLECGRVEARDRCGYLRLLFGHHSRLRARTRASSAMTLQSIERPLSRIVQLLFVSSEECRLYLTCPQRRSIDADGGLDVWRMRVCAKPSR